MHAGSESLLNRILQTNRGGEYDVIILGGGLVGLTAALLLARHNLLIAVIETHHSSVEMESAYDIRCSAISRASQRIFETIDVWESIAQCRLSAYQRMYVWDEWGHGAIDFDAACVSEPNLGHIIENRVMLKALWHRAAADPLITVFSPANPVSYLRESERVFLELGDHRRLTARLLVGADGAESWLRAVGQFPLMNWDYNQQAIVATVHTTLPHEKTAWQRFLKEGPLAFLPLKEPNVCSIVWCMSPEYAQERLALPIEHFCEEVAFAFDYRLGKITDAQGRVSFPLSMKYVKRFVDERLVLIGDAAHVIHPLAGQGVNMGLRDAAVLAEVVSEGQNADYDIGHRQFLRRYERARKGGTLGMLAGVEFLRQFFGLNYPAAGCVRHFALTAIDKIPFIKQKIIRSALGVE